MKVAAFVLVFIFLHLLCGESRGADWRVYSTNPSTQSYDQESLEEISAGVFRVWQRVDYFFEDVNEMVEVFGENYRKLNHSDSLYEVNCNERRARRVQAIDFRQNGSILQAEGHIKVLNGRPKPVDPTSLRDRFLDTESFLEAVCKRRMLGFRFFHRIFSE